MSLAVKVHFESLRWFDFDNMETASFAKIVEQHVRKALKAERGNGEFVDANILPTHRMFVDGMFFDIHKLDVCGHPVCPQASLHVCGQLQLQTCNILLLTCNRMLVDSCRVLMGHTVSVRKFGNT